MELRGVGPLIASALVAAIGDGKQFSKGRDFAASLGLTPRQHSTGGKDRLLGISKRGDSYLRKLMIHGPNNQCVSISVFGTGVRSQNSHPLESCR